MSKHNTINTMYNPLVSEYKLSFIAHRLIQTFFGGLDLRTEAEESRSVTIKTCKIVFYVYPLAIAFVTNFLIHYHLLDRYLVAFFSALISALIMAFVTLLGVRHHSVQTYPTPMSSKPAKRLISYVMPKSSGKSKLQVTLHLLVGFILIFLSVSQINSFILLNHFTHQILIAIIVYIMCWFAVINSHNSLTVGPPPETATYSTIQSNDCLSAINRPIHVIIILIAIALNYHLENYHQLNTFCIVLLTLFPVLWLLGVIPPISALFEWSVERLNVMAFGGGPSLSTEKSVIQLVTSAAVLAITYIVPNTYISSVFGYLLTLDIRTDKLFTKLSMVPLLIYTIPIFSVVTIDLTIDLIDTDLSFMNLWLIISLSVLSLVVSLIRYSQSVYIVFALIRNPLYPRSMSGPEVFQRFKAKWTKAFTLMNLITHFVIPLVCLMYTNIEIKKQASSSKHHSIAHFLSILSIVNIHRSVWQNPCLSVLILLISRTIQLIDIQFWSLTLPLIWLLVHILVNSLLNFIDKLYLVLILMFTSVAMKKQRFPMTLCLISFDLLISPFILFLVVLSSVMSVPILPLFTLPLYFISFGRPTYFWSNINKNKTETADSIYYKQMAPEFVHNLGRQCPELMACRTGSFLMGRFDDRLLWIQVLESGFNYAKIQIKGLELQETSCHAVEATAIDQMLDEAFYESGDTADNKRLAFNNYFWYAIEPLDTVVVKTYSDARNVLTGVIDSPDVSRSVNALFVRVFLWNILRERLNYNTRDANLSPVTDLNISHENTSKHSMDKTFAIVPDQSSAEVKNDKLENKTIGRSETMVEKVISFDIRSLSKWSDDDDEDVLGTEANAKSEHSSAQTNHAINSATNEKIEIKVELPQNEFLFDKVDTLPITSDPDRRSSEQLFFNNIEIKSTNDQNIEYSEQNDDNRWAISSVPTTASSQGVYHSVHPTDQWLTASLEYMYRKPIGAELIRFDATFDQCFTSMLNVLLSEDKSIQVPDLHMSSLIDSYKQIIIVCYSCLWSSFGPSVRPMNAQTIYQVFNEKIPDNGYNNEFLDKYKSLHQIVIKSFRYCLKIAIDQLLMAQDVSTDDQLIEVLTDYDQNWFIGDDTSDQWKQSVLNEKRNLFSVGKDNIKECFTSHLLTLEEKPIHLCRLNRAVIEAIWSSLSLELLYLTNDDDERYSIQANPVVVRNLTVQAANVPIGYPVYVSDPIVINHLT